MVHSNDHLNPAEADGSISIAGELVRAGEARSLNVNVTPLPTGSWLTLPVRVLCGSRPGPRVWLTATVHGEELNGMEIIHRVLQRVTVQQLSGTLVAAPVMNVLGFMNQTRTLPDGSDLNRAFPGSAEGSIAERLAHFFMQEVVAQCNYGIDLHSGANNRINPPQIRADLQDEETAHLAECFAAPIMMDSPPMQGSLRTAATEAGNRVLLFEGGEPLRFNPDSLQCGTEGVLRVLAALKMIDQHTRLPQRQSIRLSSETSWVKAPRCGILRLSVETMDEVKQGQELGQVSDVLGERPETIVSTLDGIVIGVSLNPLVAKGGGVVHLAKHA